MLSIITKIAAVRSLVDGSLLLLSIGLRRSTFAVVRCDVDGAIDRRREVVK